MDKQQIITAVREQAVKFVILAHGIAKAWGQDPRDDEEKVTEIRNLLDAASRFEAMAKELEASLK